VLELARVMSQRSFDATIVFATFAGEEQGTFGSIHYAQGAKAAGQNIAGMWSNDIIGSNLGNGRRPRPSQRAPVRPGPVAGRDAPGGRGQANDGRRERHSAARARPLHA
jgi:Zn-dependent M28 family amino/carboxypeptidase